MKKSLEGNIIIFKTLALSKILFLAPFSPIYKRIQSEFLWNSRNVKIKHETISTEFQNGGLENVDISRKISYNALTK